MITPTKITLSWLWLILLTFVSVGVGYTIENIGMFIFAALSIVSLKGQQIIDVFMELRYAPKMWRRLLMGYVIIIPAIVFLIYIL